jgi:hypothetical protein
MYSSLPYPGIRLERSRETLENLILVNRFLNTDSNHLLPDYKRV